MKRFILLLVMVALLVVSACSMPGTNKSPSDSDSEMLESARDFQLQSIDGDTVTLSELKGKPVVINFLTTWCGYCSIELPYFISAKEEYSGQVEFLFIDVQEKLSEVKAYADKKGYDNFSPLLDSNGAVAAAYGVTGFPTTIIVDSEGNIAEAFRGMIKESKLKEAVEAVKSNK